MNNEKEIQSLIKKWQPIFSFEGWSFGVRFVDFERADYQQSGNIEVDSSNKTATILISNNPRYDNEEIVVHEMSHLLLWEYDHFCENLVTKNIKDRYFDLLEEIVDKLTKTLLRNLE